MYSSVIVTHTDSILYSFLRHATSGDERPEVFLANGEGIWAAHT